MPASALMLWALDAEALIGTTHFTPTGKAKAVSTQVNVQCKRCCRADSDGHGNEILPDLLAVEQSSCHVSLASEDDYR